MHLPIPNQSQALRNSSSVSKFRHAMHRLAPLIALEVLL